MKVSKITLTFFVALLTTVICKGQQSAELKIPEAIPAASTEQTVGAPLLAPVDPVAMETVLPAPPLAPRARTNYLAAISYAPIDFPIPSKIGITAGLVKSQYQTWELEYMRGSLSVPGGFRDLGSITDTRVGLIGRTFFGDSLHIAYGVSYFDFNATVGDALMNSLSGGTYPNIDAMTVQGFGFNVGFGNTWVIQRDITIGVDWLTWAQPLFVTKRSSDYVNYTTSENDKKNVEDTMKVVSYLPRFAAVNIHVGMLF